MTMLQGYKHLALSMGLGYLGMVSGVLIGDTACGLFGFFDNYDTSKEGTGANASQPDKAGTSLMEDYFG